jgi:hypothetical protein
MSEFCVRYGDSLGGSTRAPTEACSSTLDYMVGAPELVVDASLNIIQ